jgi:uncharacterized protein
MNHGQNLLGILLLSVILLGIDLYVYQGIRTLTQGWANVVLKNTVNIGYWLVSVFVLANLIFAFRQIADNQNFTDYAKRSMNVFVILALTKVTFLFFLFGEDIYRGIASVVKLIANNGGAERFVPGRRKFISQAGLVLAAINFSSLVYGAVIGKYQYKLHRQTIFFEDLPQAFDGFTIAQVSDAHVGSFSNPDAVQRGIEMVKETGADMFVFTGDMVNNKANELEPWTGHFGQIKAPYGQFSILGNHDYGDYVNWPSPEAKKQNMNHLVGLQKSMGYDMLLNENRTIEKDGQQIVLIGVENWGHGFVSTGDLDLALRGVDKNAFKILLSHDPSHWEQKVKDHPAHIHLTLSGHTHGMQMGIETPLFKFSPVQFRYKNWAGLAKDNGRYLYVNRGFGFIGYSGRVGIWPEVTLIELRKGNGGEKLNDQG